MNLQPCLKVFSFGFVLIYYFVLHITILIIYLWY